MEVTVIGTGYVGTVTGACLAYLGHHVTCVDTDASKIARLQRGESPIYEPQLEPMLALAAARGGLDFSTELADAVRASDVIFIAVGTPPLPSGEANLAYLEAAARSIGAAMDGSRFRVVVNKSTVPVGSGNLVEALVREGLTRRAPRASASASAWPAIPSSCAKARPSPIRSTPTASWWAATPPRSRVMRELYEPLVAQVFTPPPGVPRPSSMISVPLLATSLTSAEMIKYAANAFLAMKIGFANEIANICERVGAEAPEVMAGIGLDSRIGAKFLNPGVGWGGSCFGKDIQSLLHTAREYGYSSKLLQAALDVNAAQRQMVIQKLQEKLYILKGRTIGLLGLAFKPDTDDLRDAPALHIAERLIQMGARVKAYDPDCQCRLPRAASRSQNALLRYARRNWPAMPTPWCWSRSGASFTISTWPNSRASWPTRS